MSCDCEPLLCAWCKEPVTAADDDIGRMGSIDADGKPGVVTFHRECLIRQVIGSVGHIERRCGCYVPGSDEDDPPGVSLREAARQAFELYRANNPRALASAYGFAVTGKRTRGAPN